MKPLNLTTFLYTITFCLIFCSCAVNRTRLNKVYIVEGNVNDFRRTTDNVTHSLGDNSKIKIVGGTDAQSTSYTVLVLDAKPTSGTTTTTAAEDERYTIPKTTVHQSVNKQMVAKPSVLINSLTIPFKFNPDNFVTSPGGSLGGTLEFRLANPGELTNGISGVAFAGVSQIPLNNTSTTNLEGIDVVTGLGTGLGIVFTRQKFQFGVLHGWDFYNTGGKGRDANWFCISIGFSFLNPTSL